MTKLKNSSNLKQPKSGKRVRPKAGDPDDDCREQFDIQIGLRTTVPQGPKYAVNPSVGTTFSAWSVTTDKAEGIYKEILGIESNLEQMYTSLGVIMRQFKIERDAFLVTVSGVCETDEDAKGFGLATSSGRRRPNVEAPRDVRCVFGNVIGEFTVRWPRINGAVAYLVEQSSADPALGASWAQCYTGTRASFKMTGLTLGQKLWLRAKTIAQRPSAWSEPIAVIVR